MASRSTSRRDSRALARNVGGDQAFFLAGDGPPKSPSRVGKVQSQVDIAKLIRGMIKEHLTLLADIDKGGMRG